MRFYCEAKSLARSVVQKKATAGNEAIKTPFIIIHAVHGELPRDSDSLLTESLPGASMHLVAVFSYTELTTKK